MKKQIRKSVFETNSSSTHTISISKSKAYTKIVEDLSDDVVGFRSGQFGWEHELYDTLDSKASYLWTGIIDSGIYTPEQIEKIKENIKSVLAGHGLRAWFEPYEVDSYDLSDGTKHEYCKFKDWAYIDHAACLDDWFNELFPNNGEEIYGDMLMWYLFNPNSCIETSNDNSDYESMLSARSGYTEDDELIEFYKGN